MIFVLLSFTKSPFAYNLSHVQLYYEQISIYVNVTRGDVQ